MNDTTGQAPADYVPSTSDARTTNNSMRQNYRVLTDREKALVDRVKTLGAQLQDLLHEIGSTGPHSPPVPYAPALPDPERFASRDLSLANTHVEDAVMRAVRHITK